MLLNYKITLTFCLALSIAGCLDPPSIDLGDDPSGNESNTPTSSLSVFLDSVAQSRCAYEMKCNLLARETDTVEQCVESDNAYYGELLDNECGPSIESYYESNADTLAICPDYIANQNCYSDDSGVCPLMQPLFDGCNS